jgi:N utilization substance protein A
VEIRAAAREVGSRTKSAVFSRDDAVDPVGACVGIKGSRVQAVVNELAGERIDIVPWSQDPERFAKLALAPARVARVFSDPATKTIQAVVDEDQLSLAIGRNGQNVRLASELTEWKIDLYSSREWMERAGDQPIFAPLPEDDSAVNPRLAEIDGISAATSAVLEEAGYKRLDDIIDLEREDFLRLAGIAPEEADRLMSIINELTTDDAAGGAAGNEGMAADPAEESAVGIDPSAAPLPGNEEALREINEGTADTEDFGPPVPGGEDANEMSTDAPPVEAEAKAKPKAKGKVKAEG